MGHAIGFDHTYGIPNPGSDWNGDDVVDLNPVYGDPYCIMSGMTYGGADRRSTSPRDTSCPP
jgi:hypothetical protein